MLEQFKAECKEFGIEYGKPEKKTATPAVVPKVEDPEPAPEPVAKTAGLTVDDIRPVVKEVIAEMLSGKDADIYKDLLTPKQGKDSSEALLSGKDVDNLKEVFQEEETNQ